MIRRWEWYGLAAAFLFLNFVLFRWALKGSLHFQKDVLVPDIMGKSLIDALDVLAKQDLGLKKEASEFNDKVPAGTVLRQQPASGTAVRAGKTVRITVSQGGETVYVPELAGQSLRSAEATLRTSQLSLGEVRFQPSLKYPKDTVISQLPDAKKVVSKNSLVHLSVSEGPPEDGILLMPDFVGKTWSEVQNWAADAGVKAAMAEDFSSQETEKVLQQDLPADSPLEPGQTVKFLVSAGKGGARPAGQDPEKTNFHFQVPQSETEKQYSFVLLDGSRQKEIWRGRPEPGSKLNIPCPKAGPNASVRVFVNGILTEERPLQ